MPPLLGTWPPADYRDPLPYDQRGCCGPRNPCRRFKSLELRYKFIGERFGGTVDSRWGSVASGSTLAAMFSFWRWNVAEAWESQFFFPPINHIEFIFGGSDDGPVGCNGLFYDDAVEANFILGHCDDICGGTAGRFDLTVTNAVGPWPNPPDVIHITPLAWWMTSPYWNGP